MTTVETPRQIVTTLSTDGTAVAGKHTPVDASSGNRTLTLPTSVTAGSHLSVEKVDSTGNTVTVSGSIRGSTSTHVLSARYESVTLVADPAGSWWPTAAGEPGASVAATYQTLAQGLLAWTLAQAFTVVSATRDTNEAITTASVVWPDGATGTFTTDTASTSFPGAIDAYHVTHVLGGVTKTVTQTAVTRDAGGAVTAQPALTVA